MKINTRFIVYYLMFGLGLGFGRAQNNRWVDMFSYLRVEHVQPVDTKIYAQSENAIFIYDTQNDEIEKISSVDGLSGDKISNIYYHKALKKLFIFHKGGLIEVLDEQKNITLTPDLAYNSFIPADRKKLNDIYVRNNTLYLATRYGISTYNLERNEFGDTYYTGTGAGLEQVNAVEIIDNQIYIATEHGLKKADINDNLIDYNVWQTVDNRNWDKMAQNNGNPVVVSDTKLFEYDNGVFQEKISLPVRIKQIQINDYIVLTTGHKIYVYTLDYILQNSFDDSSLSNEYLLDATDSNGFVYIGSRKHGLVKTPVDRFQFAQLHPDSPLSNHAFAVDAHDKHCWVVYGDHRQFNPYRSYREGVSSYQNGQWINIPYETFNVPNLSFVKINPTNINEVYIASAKNGLFRLKDNQIDKYFDQNNSLLQSFSGDGVRVFAMNFDSQNNLWVTQRARPALLKLKPDDTWEGISLQSVFPDIADYHGFSELVIDDEDNIWLGTEYRGVVGYNPDTGQIVSNKKGIDPSDFTYVKGLDIDKDNIMWEGNINGLRIMPNPQKMFDDPNVAFKPVKIIYENTVQLLMEGQDITDICVDGSNNKWIATLGSGVYYVNEDGTQTIYHFTKENSPLPSNDIYDMAVDGVSGMVYFATLNGMVAFKGNATEAGENMNDVYAFPNPVNQQQHDFVTIRGLIEGVSVKIVDVAGDLVYETISKGGSITWDLTAFGIYKVASGVYIALITNEDGTQTQTAKILIVK